MWSKNIENKHISSLIKFDIVDLSKDFLANTINFPKSVTSIDDKISKTISHVLKSLLYSTKIKYWLKKTIMILM